MDVIVIASGSLVALAGIGVAIWSIVSTRNQYYDEYIERKKQREHR